MKKGGWGWRLMTGKRERNRKSRWPRKFRSCARRCLLLGYALTPPPPPPRCCYHGDHGEIATPADFATHSATTINTNNYCMCTTHSGTVGNNSRTATIPSTTGEQPHPVLPGLLPESNHLHGQPRL